MGRRDPHVGPSRDHQRHFSWLEEGREGGRVDSMRGGGGGGGEGSAGWGGKTVLWRGNGCVYL